MFQESSTTDLHGGIGFLQDNPAPHSHLLSFCPMLWAYSADRSVRDLAAWIANQSILTVLFPITGYPMLR
ncbi:hypothetical protein G6F57_006759 [Rhizopus arrhizus]|uniref:Uncharacterized protein n=1 Tax=Rhizopus oryzae TaxID=64495 RepID=A0A9P6X4R2_RHIOR|nr:hypothetical protein G6F23_006229 [Rhizopus arrhizus]KAG1412105.1 hypothetical protein G6F58_008194 [Rhizopus delemar]KAG0757801.1 hypothetical protein G6F24_010237 [Rhizopus arrhizus]KAG0789556.1 hypothetical protein G6F21_006428 [Rhizopus arrhizus]KAG0798294.1 hypothetical protein G6F22_004367 [Rhizopus arrhizus]